jgi:hypothetical protein
MLIGSRAQRIAAGCFPETGLSKMFFGFARIAARFNRRARRAWPVARDKGGKDVETRDNAPLPDEMFELNEKSIQDKFMGE